MDNKEFEREDRYAVIKYNKLTNNQWALVPELLEKFDKARVDCVVVEKDWPEYHLVWAMIEHRMAGKPVPDFNLWRQADDLQQRLTAAEQRNAELVELLHTHANHVATLCDVMFRFGLGMHKEPEQKIYSALAQQQVVFAALKPTESGASE